jgi:hypothetical protein
MISAASVDWPLADAAGQPGVGIAAAFIRLRAYAYARDRSVPAWSVTSSCGACGHVLA